MDEPASAWSYENLRKNVTTAASAASARRILSISLSLYIYIYIERDIHS